MLEEDDMHYRSSPSGTSRSFCIHERAVLLEERGGNGRARRGHAAAVGGCRNQTLDRNFRDLEPSREGEEGGEPGDAHLRLTFARPAREVLGVKAAAWW
jgi:hypothetical protein